MKKLLILIFAATAALRAQTLTQTTFAQPVGINATQVQLVSSTGLLAGQYIWSDREGMTVTGFVGGSVVVTRGALGTRAAAHATSVSVYYGAAGSFTTFDQSGTCINPATVINTNNGNVWNCPSAGGQWTQLNGGGGGGGGASLPATTGIYKGTGVANGATMAVPNTDYAPVNSASFGGTTTFAGPIQITSSSAPQLGLCAPSSTVNCIFLLYSTPPTFPIDLYFPPPAASGTSDTVATASAVQSLSGKTLISPVIENPTYQDANNGNATMMALTGVASAVNYPAISNAIAGGVVLYSGLGSSSVAVGLADKNGQGVGFYSYGNAALRAANPDASTVDYAVFKGGDTGNGFLLTSSGSGTDAVVGGTVNLLGGGTLTFASPVTFSSTPSGISASGITTGTLPYNQLGTSIPVGNLAAGSGASATTFWRGDGTWATPAGGGGGSGTVTSVAITLPAWELASGSPITTSGTIAIAGATGQTAHQFVGTCNTSTTVALCTPVLTDLPGTIVNTTATGAQTLAGSLSATALTVSADGGSSTPALTVGSGSISNANYASFSTRAWFGYDAVDGYTIIQAGAANKGIEFFGNTTTFGSGYFGGYSGSGGLPQLNIGTAIASASTIAPASGIVHITGTTAIATITAPTGCTSAGRSCSVILIPDGLWTTTTAGNIAIASTAVVSRTLTMTYDPAATKWYPSY